MKRITVLTLAVVLLMLGTIRADVFIDTQCHVSNHQPGVCLWASLETLARHHHVKALDGVTAYHIEHWDGGATASDANEWLQSAGLEGWCLNDADESWLVWACEELGAVVGLKNYPHDGDYHAVLLLAFHRTVRWYDSNHPGWEYCASREWFRKHWTGIIVVLKP